MPFNLRALQAQALLTYTRALYDWSPPDFKGISASSDSGMLSIGRSGTFSRGSEVVRWVSSPSWRISSLTHLAMVKTSWWRCTDSCRWISWLCSPYFLFFSAWQPCLGLASVSLLGYVALLSLGFLAEFLEAYIVNNLAKYCFTVDPLRRIIRILESLWSSRVHTYSGSSHCILFFIWNATGCTGAAMGSGTLCWSSGLESPSFGYPPDGDCVAPPW